MQYVGSSSSLQYARSLVTAGKPLVALCRSSSLTREPRFPALGAWSLSHWTTREVLNDLLLTHQIHAWGWDIRRRKLSDWRKMCMRARQGPRQNCRARTGSDQIRPVAQSCSTLCDPMNHSTPGLPVHHQLPEFKGL